MQKKLKRILMLLIVSISLTGCSVIEGIFKAGMGVGIFIVVAIIAIVVFIISKVSGKK